MSTLMYEEQLAESYFVLRMTATVIMVLFGTMGLILNGSVFYGLMSQKKSIGGFYSLCASKTISNTMICLTFVLWASPCTLLNHYFLPHQINILFGQYGGWMPYIMGPFTQICMAFNRFCALFLPHYYGRSFPIPLSVVGVLFFWTIAIIITSFGVPEGCGFIFVIKRLAWEPEESECAVNFAVGFFYLIVATSVAANVFNTTIAIKLIMTATTSNVSRDISEVRRRKRTKMYIQSVSQDCLHVMDTINCSIISHFSEAVWYRFVFSSLLFLGIHVFDGLVMILFNKHLRPVCFHDAKSRASYTQKTSVIGTA
ncbi:unnamed protein product [Caenorhabditis bovis]|uniref:7TM GPCR serpentine receptor class x (Srx) domain-containing protein n=1 Tax=Caenorhabditis bovis TaxID=2654633 RepID=A0A8S1E539_9PELO|nr:unnamed protein product [Caenorhabditis bovis]